MVSRMRNPIKNKGFLLIVGVSAVAIGIAAISLYTKHAQRAALARARFAVGGMTIPASGPGTHQLTQATPVETAAILQGAARVPDQDIIYTLKNIRTLDNSFSTGAYVGTLGSEGHTESMHGEASYKNQDILRNSTLAIPVTVPKPVTVSRISIAGSEYGGSSYLGGIGSPRGPVQGGPTGRTPPTFPLAGVSGFPSFPIAGAYRAGKVRG